MTKLDTFTTAYLVCLLWSSTDESNDQGGDPLGDIYSIADLSTDALAKCVADCAAFQSANADDLTGFDDAQTGHDFWLTRNRHGAGFWDRGYPDGIGDRLSDAAHAFGEVCPYVSDDGEVCL
jgi:hypothetical protein